MRRILLPYRTFDLELREDLGEPKSAEGAANGKDDNGATELT